MRINLAVTSLLLFGLSVIFWIALTLFESALVGLSTQAERVLTFLLLVVPSGIGALLGVLSLRRSEGHAWIAGAGLALNAMFALFHLLLVGFAG